MDQRDREEVKKIVREELDDGSSTTRRGLLTLLGGGAMLGAASGSAAAEDVSVGGVTADTYRITDNRYGGPDTAKSQLTSVLGSSSAGAEFAAKDTGALYHWDGSQWQLKDGKRKSFTTDKLFSFHYIPNYATAGDGTADNHWIDGWNAALDDIPQGKMGVLLAPPGHYTCTKRVEMSRGIRSRQGLSDANDEHTMPMIMGGGRYTTSIYRGDGMDDHLFYYDESDDVGQNEFIIGGGMSDLALLGNKRNNTAGSNIYFANPTDSSGFIQQILRDLIVRLSPEHNLFAESRAINEMDFRNITFNRPEKSNVTITDAVARIYFGHCKFNFAQGPVSVEVDAENPQGRGEMQFSNCLFRDNVNRDCLVDGGLVRFEGCQWVVDSDVTRNDDDFILVRANDAHFEGYVENANSTTISEAILLGGPCEDANFNLQVLGNITNVFGKSGNQTRPRWQRVIGGGPLGGVDLSSTTGQFDGDLAVADGTSAATEGAWARWDDSSSVWNYVDPTGSV